VYFYLRRQLLPTTIQPQWRSLFDYITACYSLGRRETIMADSSLSLRAARSALGVAIDNARAPTFTAVAQILSRRHRQQWIPASALLPDNLKSCWSSFVKNSSRVDLHGTDSFGTVEGYYLLRHKFGNSFYFWSCPSPSFPTIEEAVHAATSSPRGEPPSHLNSLARTIEK